jgi:hypothetical protein
MAKKAELDLTKWLKEDLGFSDEEVKELAPKFETRKGKIEEGYLRQSDYSKVIAEAQKLQTELAAKNEQLNAEMVEWSAIKGSDESAALKLRTELEATQLEKFAIEQKLRTLAEEHGVDPTTLIAKPTPEPVKPEVPKFDESKFVGRDQFGAVTDYLLTVPAELAAIAQEHFDLTGVRLDTRPLIAELKARVSKKQPADLRQIWEEKNGIPEKRTAAATAAHDKEIADAEARGREAARSEAQIPGASAPGTHAPVFMGSHESKLQRPQPGTNTRGFADALRSRKYAGGAAPVQK